MFLYKIEINLDTGTVWLVVIAESDEKAFTYVDSHLARQYIKSPVVKEAVIVEKKRIEKGSGYILDTF